MIPGQFDYVRPGNLDEALRILKDREGEAKVLSGGYSLLPLVKLRLAQPGLLVDLQAIGGLDGIAEDDDWLRIGGRATHRQIGTNEVIVASYPMTREIAGGIGDPQVRNWGTIGGSVAHADPALGLARRAARHQRDDRLPRPRRRARDQGPRLLPRHVHHRDRAHRDPDRGPDPAPHAGQRRQLPEARATGRRLRDRRGVPDRGPRRRRDDPPRRHRHHRRLVVAVRGDRRGAAAHRAEAGRRACSGPPAAAAAAASQPVSDVRGPEAYKRAMVAELTVRALRAATARALAFNG